MTQHRSENHQPTSEVAGHQEVPTQGHSEDGSEADASVSDLKPRAFSIRELSFMGPSSDGTRLLLVDSDGNQFELPVDSRLISVVSREHAPKPQTAVGLTGPSPREIQQRVRHGASIKDIADSAAVSEEHVARFAHPVITERAHMAARAQEILVTIDSEQVPLVEAVSSRIASRGIETDALRWDAWRREGGGWTVSVAYPEGIGEQLATFSFDPTDNSISPVGDQATWILERANQGPRSVPALVTNSRSQQSADTSSPARVAQDQDELETVSPEPPAPSESDPERARSWDRAHPAAKAHERRGAAADQASERVEEAAKGREEHPANGAAQGSPQSAPQAPVSAPTESAPKPERESPHETPQWEELLFGSPREED